MISAPTVGRINLCEDFVPPSAAAVRRVDAPYKVLPRKGAYGGVILCALYTVGISFKYIIAFLFFLSTEMERNAF